METARRAPVCPFVSSQPPCFRHRSSGCRTSSSVEQGLVPIRQKVAKSETAKGVRGLVRRSGVLLRLQSLLSAACLLRPRHLFHLLDDPEVIEVSEFCTFYWMSPWSWRVRLWRRPELRRFDGVALSPAHLWICFCPCPLGSCQGSPFGPLASLGSFLLMLSVVFSDGEGGRA